jgi:hypothetical protein
MPGDNGLNEGLRYDVMVEGALRGVVREALNYVVENGLPGDHHFYVTFRTGHPDVVMPDHLRQRYPREMTIVLQYQFWDLDVREDGFAVTLTFNNVSERLSVPFEAVIAFADPSVRFGLQFEAGEEEATGESETPQEPASNESSSEEAPTEGEPGEEAGSEGGEGEKIVTLDKFRKKH